MKRPTVSPWRVYLRGCCTVLLWLVGACVLAVAASIQVKGWPW